MRFALVLALVGMSMVTDGAGAEPRSDESVLRALWSDPESSRNLFSEIALRQLPITQIAETWNAPRDIEPVPRVERYATLFLNLHDRTR